MTEEFALAQQSFDKRLGLAVFCSACGFLEALVEHRLADVLGKTLRSSSSAGSPGAGTGDREGRMLGRTGADGSNSFSGSFAPGALWPRCKH
jgi:hypothetical protein